MNNLDSGSEGEVLIIAFGALILVITLFFRFGMPALQKNNSAAVITPDKIQVGINK